jgi:predicted NBD/HSP70 family sugar kinase
VGAPAVLQLAREHGLASGAAAATPADGAAVSQANPTAEATARAEAAAEAEATAEAETAAEKAKSARAGDAAAITPAAEAVRRASEGATGGDAFLGELASRLATGLATIVAVLDPELVVLTGEICRAGGEALAARVQRLLHEGSPLRPSVLPSAIDGNPVLIGALDQALGVAREEVFGAGDLSQLHRTPSPTPRTTARSEL